MKRFFTLAAIAAAFATFAACEPIQGPDDPVNPTNKTVRLNAYTEKQTRTTIGNDYSVVWSKNDKILVFGITNTGYKNSGNFTLVEGAGTSSGVFEGSIEQDYAAYFAIYPHDIVSSIYEDGTWKVTLPSSNAIYAEQNFIDGANPMVAAGTESSGLQFKNVCGILELQLTGEGTVTSLALEVGADDPCIAGEFVIDSASQTLYQGSETGGLRTITAQLAEPIQLSKEQARSVYAILPPGTYSQLKVSTTDTAGNTISHTASNPITVKRSQITPVSQFTHEVEALPYVALEYLPDESNFAASRVKMTLNEYASGGHIVWMTEEDYLEESKNYSDLSIIVLNEKYKGGKISASNSYLIDTHFAYGGNIVLLAMATDAEGHGSPKYISKITFKTKDIPVDSSCSISFASEPVITPTSFAVTFVATPAQGRASFIWLTKAEYEAATQKELEFYSVTYNVSSYTNGQLDIENNLFTPNTEYVLLYRSANGISDGIYEWSSTGYSPMKTYSFKTPEMDYSNATISLSTATVRDWSAELNVSMKNAVKYKVYTNKTGGFSDGTNIESFVDQYGTEGPATDTKIFVSDLQENTSYTTYALAYGSDGKYSHLASITYTTTEVIPEPSSAFNNLLGEYTFSSQNGARGNDPRPVTISKHIDGKVMKISGLMHPDMANQVADASLYARFINGQIHISGTIADYGTFTPVWCAPYGGGSLVPGGTLVGTMKDGVIEFMDKGNLGLTGLLFYQTTDPNGAYQNGAIDYYEALKLTKVGGSNPTPANKSNSTESFTRTEEVIAGWK